MNGTSSTCAQMTDHSFTVALDQLSSTQGLDLQRIQPPTHDIHQWHTAEGAHVQFIANRDRPMFDLVLRFKAGSAFDGDKPGLAALTFELLDGARVAEQLQGVGAILKYKIARDYAMFMLRGLSLPALRARVMQLVTQIIARPAFGLPDFSAARKRLLDEQEASNDVDAMLLGAIEAHMFAGHPYATAHTGTTEGLARITQEQVATFHRQAYGSGNLEIGLVGDLSLEEAETLIAPLVQALPQHWMAITPPPLPITKGQTVHLEQPGSNTRIWLTLPLRAYPTDTDYPALLMVDKMLGANFESRLTTELRLRRGLTYAIQSVLVSRDAGCLWHIIWDTRPAYRDASLALVLDLITCFSEQGPTKAECEFALNHFAGQLLRLMADSAALAKGLTILGHRKHPADQLAHYLDKLAVLEPENIRQVARGMNLNEAFIVTAGPTVDQQPLPTIGEPASP
ncbi:M16 family metallopeptidase [Pseudomonas guariconensis]|uniref:M16 family metallopeptidase n=1 Tax=Pseudomonas guariconensis TaxID=1288410 RepID=UPI0018A9C109|nr:pitrilysin family protein [Pseudomonas guariconensis]MBF8743792.1 insulinase family protein [Pseudomonas guariconensis]MBF8753337.1 insulinase family protein [Pseudomonas guariconensis]